MATQAGEADFFPGVSAANAPIEETINGTIVIDGNVPPGRLVNAPVTCRLEKGIIVDIEGGVDASALRAHFDESGEDTARHLCHFTIGLNPRAKTSGNTHQDEHVLGAITFGFGSQDSRLQRDRGARAVCTRTLCSRRRASSSMASRCLTRIS